MLTDLTKVDWDGIIRQKAPAVKEGALKAACAGDAPEMYWRIHPG